jgi:hypothetical protein
MGHLGERIRTELGDDPEEAEVDLEDGAYRHSKKLSRL